MERLCSVGLVRAREREQVLDINVVELRDTDDVPTRDSVDVDPAVDAAGRDIEFVCELGDRRDQGSDASQVGGFLQVWCHLGRTFQLSVPTW